MSTSKHISDESFRRGDATDNKNDVSVGHNQDKLVKLRSMRKKVNDKIERERQEFIRELQELICDWKDQLPDIRGIFGKEEIDHLLYVCATSIISYHGRETERFVDFVIRTGYKDKPEIDEITGKPLSRRTTPVHWAARRKYNLKLVGQLFEIYNRFDVNYIDELGVSHFHIACENGLYDVVEKFLELGQDPNCCLLRESNASSVDPPLHLALKYGHKATIELLLRNGANPNLVNKEGLTLLQITSMEGIHEDIHEDVARMIFEMTHDKYLPVRVDVGDDSGNTPLHVALKWGNKELTALLLRNGANPNLANKDGYTPLILICMGYGDDVDLRNLLEVSDEVDRPVQVDVHNNSDWSPLHWTLLRRRKKLFEILLRRGANPNVASEQGLTALHLICLRWYDENKDDSQWAKMLFEISNENHLSVLVDARDNKGNTPLHTAMSNNGHVSMVEFLLRRGADPNAANANGLTPLHVICQKVNSGDSLAELFFKICDEKHLQLQVNAVDESGRTPLQLAVASLLPDAVELLLNRGADLSSFVFPPSIHIVSTNFSSFFTDQSSFNLTTASRALIVIEHLEIRGYDLDRNGVITIVKFFDQHGLIEPSPDLEQCWYKDEVFAIDAKKEMVKPNLSLYELIQLRPEKARKLLSYKDFYELGRTCKSWKLSGRHHQEACELHLCEMMSRGFFRRWALESFLELTQYRLPILCCRMIIEQLSNKNLYHTCLATTIQSS